MKTLFWASVGDLGYDMVLQLFKEGGIGSPETSG